MSNARWRTVVDPKGTLAVLSDREPGPMMGQPGGLEHWRETCDPVRWTDFDTAMEAVRAGPCAIIGDLHKDASAVP